MTLFTCLHQRMIPGGLRLLTVDAQVVEAPNAEVANACYRMQRATTMLSNDLVTVKNLETFQISTF